MWMWWIPLVAVAAAATVAAASSKRPKKARLAVAKFRLSLASDDLKQRYATALEELVELSPWSAYQVVAQQVPVVATDGSIDEAMAEYYVPSSSNWETVPGGVLVAALLGDSLYSDVPVDEECAHRWYYSEDPFWCCRGDDCVLWNAPPGLNEQARAAHAELGYRIGSWLLEAEQALLAAGGLGAVVPLLEGVVDDMAVALSSPLTDSEREMIDHWKMVEGAAAVLGHIPKFRRQLMEEIQWALTA